MSALSDFYEPMRVLLGDNDPQQNENSDAQLSAALRTSFVLQAWPKGYTVSGEAVTPDLPLGLDFATVLMETVIAMTVGGDGAYSFVTRALSETDHGEKKRDILQYARQKLYELRDGDAAFSSRQTFVAFLNTIGGLGDLATATVLPNFDFTVDLNGGGLTLNGGSVL